MNTKNATTVPHPGIRRIVVDGKVSYSVKVSKRVKLRDGKPKRLQREGTADTIHLAKQLHRELLSTLELKAVNIDRKLFGDFQEEFLEWLQGRITSSVLHRQKGIYTDQIFGPLAKVRMDELTTGEIETMINRFSGTQRKRLFLGYFRKIYKRARRVGYVTCDPTEAIDPLPPPKPRTQVLNVEQTSMLLDYLSSHDRPAFYHAAIAVYTGMRAGELRALRWLDVSLKKGIISVRGTEDTVTGLKNTTKNGETREVPINSKLHTILDQLKAETFTRPTDPVLPKWRPFQHNEQALEIRKYCKLLDLPQIRFHDLRATFITNCLEAAIPVKTVKDISGHSSWRSFEVYVRKSGRDIKGMTESLDFSSPTRSLEDSASSDASES